MRPCAAGVNVMGFAFGCVVVVKVFARVNISFEMVVEAVTISRDAIAAFDTKVDFLYAGCRAISRYSSDAGATWILVDPSCGSVITTGSAID